MSGIDRADSKDVEMTPLKLTQFDASFANDLVNQKEMATIPRPDVARSITADSANKEGEL